MNADIHIPIFIPPDCLDLFDTRTFEEHGTKKVFDVDTVSESTLDENDPNTAGWKLKANQPLSLYISFDQNEALKWLVRCRPNGRSRPYDTGYLFAFNRVSAYSHVCASCTSYTLNHVT